MYKLSLVFKVDTTRYFNIWEGLEKEKKWGFSISSKMPPANRQACEMYFSPVRDSAFLNSAQFTYNCGIRTIEFANGPDTLILLELVEVYWRRFFKIGMLIGSDYINGPTICKIKKALGWQFGPIVANPNMGSTDPSESTYHPIQFFWKDISNLKTEHIVANWKPVLINSTQTPPAQQPAIFAEISVLTTPQSNW